MTAVLAGYDRPIENLIDELSATGHVNHDKFPKRSVTLHHNGGVRFSHRTILNIWKSRPASAHFDVDAIGELAQYVEEHEYAWAVGDTVGNEETISIEMANISAAPHWEVAQVTWVSAARLAGFLFAHVIEGHPRPSEHNLFVHHHWSQTSCAGPFVDATYPEILATAQSAYDHFHAPTIVQQIQRTLEVVADGKWGSATDHRARLMRAACMRHLGYPDNTHLSFDIFTVQRIIDTNPDGAWGPKSQAALENWLRFFQHILGVKTSGRWTPATEDRFERIRNSHLIKS